jgi:parallel beta-helix repeat protein/predicted outer membrane repeat protein
MVMGCDKMGKLLFLIATFIVVILFSGAVSAASTIYVNGTSGNDTYDGTSPTWVSGTIGPKKTIQNASNAVDTSGTVNVASGTYNEHITTTKSLNLIGANRDNTIIDGTNNGQPLYLDYDLNIANFTIRNGASTYGGGIYNYANLNITNCFITENTATNAGGALYNYYSGTLTITNSSITGNTAPYCGGIANLGTLTLNNSTLTGNTATGGDAGAIYNEGTLTINNSTLTGNTATNYGGAIYNEYGTVTINNSTLTGNTATNRGGAIYNRGTITISNSTLTGNTANYGGAIYNSGIGAVVVMHFNRVTSNSPNAIYTTAVIAAENNWWGSNSNPSSQFTGTVNYSPWLYMTLTANPTLILNGSTSQLNASFNNAYNGVVITPIDPSGGHLPDGSLITFTTDLGSVGSKTTTKNSSNGAAIATFTANEGTGTAHLTAQLDSQTTTTTVGIGTLYVNEATGNNSWDGTSPTYISGTTGPMKTIQTAVNAINAGGTINVASATYIVSGDYFGHINIGKSLNLIGENLVSTIIDGANNGRLIFIGGGLNVTIANFTLRNGTFGGTGGAIATLSNLTIINCNLTGNTATDGGAIYNSDTILTIINSSITGNNATQHGGAIYNYGGTLTLNNSTLTGNTATGGDAGAIYNEGTLTINNSTLSGNTAGYYGGAILNYGSTININNSTLTGNTANYGGAIYHYDGTLTINNSTLSGNTAVRYGGAIYNYDFSGTVTITNSTLTGNTANYGGAIYNNEGTLTITNSTLTGNTATFDGGAIYNNYYCTVIMHFNRLVGNSPNAILTDAVIDAENNWWGSNYNPSSQFSGSGTVNYAPWLYMTLIADPALVLNGATSTLTASFNNVHDGEIITPINPANGHLPDGSGVTFTTDLGSVGSKTTTKNTSNGIAIATLTADESIGTANITAQLDSQILNTNVEITNTLYVNGATGDDRYDGSSPIYISGNRGPMATITNALNNINSGWTINVASGTYVEKLFIENNINLVGNGTNSFLTPLYSNDEIITIAGKLDNVMISGFTIQGATSGIGVAIKGNGVTIKDNNIFNNDMGITLGEGTEKVTISGNNIKYNNIGIYTFSEGVKVNFNSIFENNVDIYSEIVGINAQYNWWGSNSAPEILNVINSPWLYMTLSTNPDVILNGGTSEMIVSFNNGFDGETLTPIDPADGHLQDNSPVRFTTDLGSLGSKTTTKNTTNGIATATLTADESPGTATVSAEFDNQLLTSPVIIVPARYVNGLTGDDTYDGSSPVWISGLVGPMRTIQTAVNAIEATGTVSVASGTYNENIVVDKLVQIINGGSGIVTVRATNAILPVFLINPAGSGTTIQGLNITGGSTGIYLNSANNCNLTGNNLTGNSWSGIGISNAQGTVVDGNNVSGNQEGIYILNGSTNNTITGNTIIGNQFSGVCVDTSYNTNISGNGLISGNSNGIRLFHAVGNFVTSNNLLANLWCAIVLDGSSNNQITGGNTLTNNVEGIHLMNNANNNIINGTNITGNSSSWCGISVWNSTGNNLTNNTVTGKQEGIYLTQSASYNTVSLNNIHDNLNSAICLDQNSQHNNIQNNTNINLNGNGIRLYQVTLNTITLNTVTHSVWAAICLDNSSNNTVSWNTASNNQEGIYVFNNANNNAIINNTATNNAYSGICVNNAVNNTLNWNTITCNGNGIRLYNYANLNNVTHNNVTGQGWAGVVIDNSYQNTLTLNTIQGNGEGLYSMNGSSNNLICTNNLVNNTNHNAYEDGTTNTYDNGVVGNYWSDYGGSGPYAIQIGNVDNHPSLTPF